MDEQTKSRSSRRYDAQFKADAIALVQSGKTIREVAGGLGITTWSLRRWIADARNGKAPTEPKTLSAETPEQRENRRLRQELEYLRRQRDILKKALAIVSDGHLNSASNS